MISPLIDTETNKEENT